MEWVWPLLVMIPLAQTPDIPISSASGWAGAGLLTGVLGWLLFFYLPRRDAEAKAREDTLLTMFREELKEGRATSTTICHTFEKEMVAEREACEKRIDQIFSGKGIKP